MMPLYEAKMLHQYDHRWATYDGLNARDVTDIEKLDPTFAALPRYWVAQNEVDERLAGRWDRPWLLGWRDIARTTDERTQIASAFDRVAVGHTEPILVSVEPDLLCSIWTSLPYDYVTRQKVGGTHLTYTYVHQLPVFPPHDLDRPAPWARPESAAKWIRDRTVELTYSAWDMKPFARRLADTGAPFRWDPERRFLLRAELDAAFFHVYGIARDDVDYILDTFSIMRRKDETAHGGYRTKRVILEVFDAIQGAIDNGEPYRTILDPPPGQGARHAPREVTT